MSKIKTFLEKYAASKAKYDQWMNLHQECYDFAMPNKSNFNDTRITSIKRSNINIFDNTAIEATSRFASRFQQLTAPVGQKFFRLTLSDYAVNEIERNAGDPIIAEQEISEMQQMLDDITTTIFHYYNKSNINSNIHECFHDLAVGTCAMIINENNDNRMPFIASSIPLYELYILDGKFGTIDTVFRKHYIPFRTVKQMWPEAKLKFFDTTRLEDPLEKVEVIEGISVLDSGTTQYMVVVEDKEIYSATYLSNPFIVSRYKVGSGETYGRGPLMDVLNDVKLVNKAQEYVLKAAEKSTSELFLVADDDQTTAELGMTLGPDMIIPLQDINNFQRLPFQGRVDVAQLFVAQKQENIKRTLLANTMDQKKALSPEELEALTNENLFDMAPIASRLYNEFMTPILKRILDILIRKNIVKTEFDVDNGLKFEYTTPMAMLYKVKETQQMLSALQQISNAVGAQEAATVCDLTKIAKQIALNNNILSKFVRSDMQIAQLKEQQQQQQQQMMMAQQEGAQ